MPYREPLTPVEDWAMRGLIALTCLLYTSDAADE